MSRAVVLVSGGMDSATAVYEAMARGYEPLALHTSYGQATETKEFECARRLAEEVGTELLGLGRLPVARVERERLVSPRYRLVDGGGTIHAARDENHCPAHRSGASFHRST